MRRQVAAGVLLTAAGALGALLLGGVALPQGQGGSPGVYSVVDCGAVPNDGQDDRAAIQACADSAIANGGVLYFPAGEYSVARSAPCACSIDLTGAIDVLVRGDGPSSVVKMIGDGANGDWYAFKVSGAADVAFERLTIDGNQGALTNTDEQTHLIQVAAASAAVTRLSLDHMVLRDSAGDGLRLVGDVTNQATDVSASRTMFLDNNRAGVSVQRGLHVLQLSYCLLRGGDDQVLDYEPSAPGGNSQLVAIGNVFDGQGKIAVSLGGYSADPNDHHDSVFEGNIVLGALAALNIRRITIANNVIYGDAAAATPLVHLRKSVSDVSVTGNLLWHTNDLPPPSGGQGAALEISHHNSGSPGPVVVANNRIIQQAWATAVSLESVDDAVITGNYIRHENGAGLNGILLRATARALNHATVSDNQLVGTYGDCIVFASSPNDIGRVAVTGNLCTGATNGVKLNDGGGAFLVPPVILGNTFDVTNLGVAAGLVPYLVGGNVGGVASYAGYGAPALAAAKGSEYVDTNSGNWYRYIGGSWVLQ